MRRSLGLIIAAIGLNALVADIARTEQEIVRFEGNRSTRTQTFEVNGPWLLDWRINSDYRRQAGFELRLLDGDSSQFHSQIMKARQIGNGLKLFDEPGRFRFEIVSNYTDWTLKVIQLTEEEADRYTPTDAR